MLPLWEEAFKKAKDALPSSNVLVHYDPSLPVILESDAGLYGIGAVIFYRFPNGDERPIAYASRSLKSSESFYTTLFGRKFTLRTDHKPLLKMLAMDSAKKKCGRRNLSCGLSDDAQSLPLKSLRKGLGTPC